MRSNTPRLNATFEVSRQSGWFAADLEGAGAVVGDRQRAPVPRIQPLGRRIRPERQHRSTDAIDIPALLQQLMYFLDPPAGHHDVIVCEGNDAARSPGNSRVPPVRHALPGLPDVMDGYCASSLGSSRSHPGSVSGPVIDDDDFEGHGRAALEKRPKAARQQLGAVTRADDDRHVTRLSHTLLRHSSRTIRACE